MSALDDLPEIIQQGIEESLIGLRSDLVNLQAEVTSLNERLTRLEVTPNPTPEEPEEPEALYAPVTVSATTVDGNKISVYAEYPYDRTDVTFVFTEAGSPGTEWELLEPTRISGVLAADGRTYQYAVAARRRDETSAFVQANPITLGDTPSEPVPEPEPTPEPADPPSSDTLESPLDKSTIDSVISDSKYVIKTNGTTIENTRFEGDLEINASNVTLRNVSIAGKLSMYLSYDIKIHGWEAGSLTISSSQGIEIVDGEIFGRLGADGMHITSDRTVRCKDIIVKRVYVHNPIVHSTSHYDGVQFRGIEDALFEDVVWDLGPHKPQYTAAIFLEEANGGNKRVTFRRCVALGGGYPIYLGGADIVFDDLVVGNGRYGILYPGAKVSNLTMTNVKNPHGETLTLSGTSGSYKLS